VCRGQQGDSAASTSGSLARKNSTRFRLLTASATWGRAGKGE
jgi:hypothetical protein